MNNFRSVFDELSKLYEEIQNEDEKELEPEEAVEESCVKEELVEAAEDDVIEIEDDEVDEVAPEEEPAVEEPRQLVIECAKCGALVIKDEADITSDEESGLVNMDDACAYCEESEGYKIIGSVLPYEADAELEEEAELQEILDFDVPINVTANGNSVAVGGMA